MSISPTTTRLAGWMIALSAIATLVAAPSRAEACLPELPCVEARYPRDGAVDVPTNTQLWLRNEGIFVLSAEGTEPVEVEFSGIANLATELLPNTTYTLTATNTGESQASCEDITLTFTTGSGADAAPVAPTFISATSTFYPPDPDITCLDEWRYGVEVVVAEPTDPNTIANRVYKISSNGRTLVAETVVQARAYFSGWGTAVQGNYELVAVAASGTESAPTAFNMDATADGGTAGSGCQAGAAGSWGMNLILTLAALSTRRTRDWIQRAHGV